MKTIKNYLLLTFTLFSLAATCLAQNAVETYLSQTNPLLGELQKNIQSFVADMQPLREKNDILGLKQAADKYVTVWSDMLAKLAQIEPPADATTHYQALQKLLELQRESNQYMAETLNERIAVILKIQEMRKAGKSQEEIDAYANSNSLNKEEVLARTNQIKTETAEADSTLKSEQERLLNVAGGD